MQNSYSTIVHRRTRTWEKRLSAHTKSILIIIVGQRQLFVSSHNILRHDNEILVLVVEFLNSTRSNHISHAFIQCNSSGACVSHLQVDLRPRPGSFGDIFTLQNQSLCNSFPSPARCHSHIEHVRPGSVVLAVGRSVINLCQPQDFAILRVASHK